MSYNLKLEIYIDNVSGKELKREIFYDEKGIIIEERYYNTYNDNLHREDGAALKKYNTEQKLFLEQYFLQGKCHRENQPALIRYYKNGNKKCETFYLKDSNHKTVDKYNPGQIEYHPNGIKKFELYYENGKCIFHIPFNEIGEVIPMGTSMSKWDKKWFKFCIYINIKLLKRDSEDGLILYTNTRVFYLKIISKIKKLKNYYKSS